MPLFLIPLPHIYTAMLSSCLGAEGAAASVVPRRFALALLVLIGGCAARPTPDPSVGPAAVRVLPPDHLSDAEVAAIVGVARAGVVEAEPPSTRIPFLKRLFESHPAQAVPPDQPPLYIRRDAEGRFEVYFGHQEGPLSGGGTRVVVERSGDAYKAVSSGFWVS